MSLKARIRSQFPAVVSVTSPLTLTKNGAAYTFGYNASLGPSGPSGAGYGGSSTTSLLIAAASKTFTTQAGLAYLPGNYVRASSAANGANYMEGFVTSYLGTSLIISVSKIGGSGTFADWNFAVGGTPGAGTGDLLSTSNLSDVANKKTAKDNLSVHGADVASATTTNLETATGDLVDVTGTTTITAITLNEGHERTVRFTGILTLTNGASLVLPGGANITTAAGDFAVFRGYASSVVRCVGYTPAAAATGSGANVLANSPTLITPIITGITSGTPPATGKVGEYIQSVIALSPGVNATSGSGGQVWNSIGLTAGIWLVGGSTGVYGTSGTATITHMHSDHGNGTTSIQTTPGSGSTTAAHLTTNNSNGWIFPLGIKPYFLSGSATINAVATTDFTSGPVVFYGALWGLRIA